MSVTTLVWSLVATGGASLVIALLLTPLAIRIARRARFVDQPGGHKSHVRPVPYGGGAAIFAAAFVPVLAAIVATLIVSDEWVARTFGELATALLGGMRAHALRAGVIVGGAALLFVLGLVDDLRPQGPLVKLGVMLIVAVLVASVGSVRLAEFAPAPVSVALTVVWIVVVTNCFNFLDNMDGLSSGVAAICMAFLIVCGISAGQFLVPALASVFLGALLGFLVFNFPPARVFMGDAGSLVVGYMLAVVSIMTSYWESGVAARPLPLAMPLVVLAVPLYDFISVVIIRLFEGRNPLRGDQRHFSHRLVQRGLSRRQAVLTIYLATATTGLGATLLPNADLRGAITVLAMVVLVLLIVAILEAPLRKDA